MEQVEVKSLDNTYFGCLAAYSSSSTISNVYVTGDIVGESSVVGGLIGAESGTTMINSYSNVDIQQTSYPWSTGGLIGWNDGGFYSLTNCYSAGKIDLFLFIIYH